ncbi:hypothetical protein SDC9_120626 [bioreactor metagenome]|uniref:Uncharacterized protein n=1 Tax=bioreactor metagenome TaxID=1076179 RepID=A0A645C9S8_9ZZZZ
MLSPKAMDCCRRIMTASAKPRRNMTRPRIMYMMPIFLWSIDVSQSRHSGPHRRNLVMPPTTTRPPSTTAMKVMSTMGSCVMGIWSHVMRPSSQCAAGVDCSDTILSLFCSLHYCTTAAACARWASSRATTLSAFWTVHTSCGRFRPAAFI